MRGAEPINLRASDACGNSRKAGPMLRVPLAATGPVREAFAKMALSGRRSQTAWSVSRALVPSGATPARLPRRYRACAAARSHAVPPRPGVAVAGGQQHGKLGIASADFPPQLAAAGSLQPARQRVLAREGIRPPPVAAPPVHFGEGSVGNAPSKERTHPGLHWLTDERMDP